MGTYECMESAVQSCTVIAFLKPFKTCCKRGGMCDLSVASQRKGVISTLLPQCVSFKRNLLAAASSDSAHMERIVMFAGRERAREWW